MNPFGFRSLYDLAPMQERMKALIDFGQLKRDQNLRCGYRHPNR